MLFNIEHCFKLNTEANSGLQKSQKGMHRSGFHGSETCGHTFGLLESQKGRHRYGFHGSKKKHVAIDLSCRKIEKVGIDLIFTGVKKELTIHLTWWKDKKVSIDLVYTGVKKIIGHTFRLMESRKGRYRSGLRENKKCSHRFGLIKSQKGRHLFYTGVKHLAMWVILIGCFVNRFMRFLTCFVR